LHTTPCTLSLLCLTAFARFPVAHVTKFSATVTYWTAHWRAGKLPSRNRSVRQQAWRLDMNRNSQDCKGYMAVEITFCLVIALKFGDLYRAYPALLGADWQERVLPDRQTQWALAYCMLPLAVNSISERKQLAATAGIRTGDLQNFSSPLWPLGQVPAPQKPKHVRGGWLHCTDTSEPVDGNGAENMVTVQFEFPTSDLSITGPTRLPTALSGPSNCVWI
jgi:hypothetical protein